MRPRYWPPAALALALLGIAGCGGGGDEETTATPTVAAPTATTLSKDELIEQGDAICAEVNAAVGTIASTGTDSAGRVSQEAAIYGGMVERLKGLGTPEDEVGYEEFIAAAEGLAQAESNAQLAAERGDSEGLETAESEVSAALASFQSAARTYGFEDCSEAPSAPVPSAGTTPSSESESAEGAEEEAAPEEEAEPAPETGGAGGAGSPETGGGGAPTGGAVEGGAPEESGGSSGGIGPGG